MKMHCTRCHSLMAETHHELHPSSKQSWYKCPVCDRSQMVSEPLNDLAQASAQLDGYPYAQSPASVEH